MSRSTDTGGAAGPVDPDVIVLGAGAAGLMCAAVAAGRGRSVTVLERNDRVGEKIRISGGGRCNFTNVDAGPDNFLSSNPHFAKSALTRFTPADFIRMVERHGIRYHEKAAGQLFCDGSSREVVAMLGEECRSAGVTILTGCDVKDVSGGSGSGGSGFTVSTSKGDFRCASLVVATGGLSIPTLGATDLGYRIAKKFGLPIIEPRPGLVPLTLAGDDLAFAAGLSGVSVEAVVSAGKASFRENILFTHRGLSGPAVLQASSYWTPGSKLSIDLSPAADVRELLLARREGKSGLNAVLSEILPRRFVKAWCDRFALPQSLAWMSKDEIGRIAAGLHGWRLRPSGTEGFSKAEVTCGGIDTRELSSKTMEAKKAPGLYCVGEVVDVTGWLGGYNFQWAWASGFVAGQYA
jgi:predicted Rossmann fold flavoprotein